ncbi:hypothetical protein MJH12_02640 [bacterium]|nr:hypothetical protein [bacterium]
MNKAQLKIQTINLIKAFTNESNIISSTYPPSSLSIANNLDDLFPFFQYLGLDEVIQNQIDSMIQINGKFPTKNNVDIPLWTYDEWIGALLISKDKRHHSIACEILSEIISKSHTHFMVPHLTNSSRNVLNYFIPRSYGIFEVVFENKDRIPSDLYNHFLKLFDQTLTHISDKDFLPVIDKGGLNLFSQKYRLNLLNNFYHSKGYKRHIKIFLIKLLNYKFRKTMKESSNFLFSYLEFLKIYPQRKDLYKKLIRNIIQTDGIPIKTFSTLKEYTVCQSTAIIDNICDYIFFIEPSDEFINYAKELSNFFIEQFKKSKTLLRSEELKVSFVDEVMDFAIALKRVFEITDEKIYEEYANLIFASCKTFYDGQQFYYSYFDTEQQKGYTIDPKYNFLLLKGFIIFDLQKDKSIYSNELYHLAKDR